METNEDLITLARRLPELFQEAQLGETRYLEEDDLAALDATGYAAVAVAQKLADALEAATAAAGVTPQEPGERAALLAEVDAAKVRPALHDIPDLLFRVRAALAAPVRVDEAKLAEIVRRVDSHEWSRMGGSHGEQVADIVRAVLRGGGQ